ncbi:MAG TPA: TolC family protein [Vicinamibacterales bacterium]|jgi:outer membrane protein TolC
MSAFGQTTPPAQPPAQPAPQAAVPSVAEPPEPASPVDNGTALTVEDAVKMALANNLQIQEARLNPELAEYTLEQAQTLYAPQLVSSFSQSSAAAPPTDFLSSGVSVVTSANLTTTAGLQQLVPFGGGQYALRWSGSRATSDASRVVFSPQIGSQMVASYSQPLLQNFKIDYSREQVILARNNASIQDLALRQRITQTSYAVRAAYYNLIGAIEGWKVSEQSLQIAQLSLSQNQQRFAVGTIAQIDLVSSKAEVANNEEAVVIEEGAIASAEDQLRALVMNSSQPGFWTVTYKPVDPEQVAQVQIDVDAAVKNALQSRTDLLQFKKTMDNNDVAIKFESNQKLPQLSLQGQYGVQGIGGTEFSYDPTGLSSTPIGTSIRSFGDVLQDVLGNNFRTWSVALNFSYPIGESPASAALAQARVNAQQQHTTLTDMETQVTTQVREAAREVQTNYRRVEVDRQARELSQEKLDAENKRFAVGLSSTLELFTAERDLAAARRAELAAEIAYSQSLAAFQAVQLAPLQ